MSLSITDSYLTRYRAVVGTTADPTAFHPLTGAQRRFLLARALDPLGRPDLAPLFFHFPRGALDLSRLRRAAVGFAGRHTVLRGRVGLLKGVPVLHAGEPSVDVRRVPVPAGAARDALRAELGTAQTHGPALRLLLACGPEEEQETLAVVLDHLACDEQSLGAVVSGISRAYEDTGNGDGPRHGAEDGAVYREAVESQLEAERTASTEASLTYWGERLSGLGGPVAGPPQTQDAQDAQDDRSPEKGMLSHVLPAVPPRSRGVLFPALLDAGAAALRTWSAGGGTPALGYPWGGRPAGQPDVMGCFINTLVHPAASGPARIEDTAAAWWDDLDHAGTPYDEVVRAVRLTGGNWQGTLDGILTFEDLGRRSALRLAGETGRETHVAAPLRYAAPVGVAASYGDELLVRLVWERSGASDDLAQEAFGALLDSLRRHLYAALPTAVAAP
ncbi:condensation domain-containing protein [Streptomyces sp. SS7]|uniref:condensation domain-containing protein n=1 Tax=Streptomyces sp. SS7 TaxID=3108485 RepID=UPI0030EE32DE